MLWVFNYFMYLKPSFSILPFLLYRWKNNPQTPNTYFYSLKQFGIKCSVSYSKNETLKITCIIFTLRIDNLFCILYPDPWQIPYLKFSVTKFVSDVFVKPAWFCGRNCLFNILVLYVDCKSKQKSLMVKKGWTGRNF